MDCKRWVIQSLHRRRYNKLLLNSDAITQLQVSDSDNPSASTTFFLVFFAPWNRYENTSLSTQVPQQFQSRFERYTADELKRSFSLVSHHAASRCYRCAVRLGSPEAFYGLLLFTGCEENIVRDLLETLCDDRGPLLCTAKMICEILYEHFSLFERVMEDAPVGTKNFKALALFSQAKIAIFLSCHLYPVVTEYTETLTETSVERILARLPEFLQLRNSPKYSTNPQVLQASGRRKIEVCVRECLEAKTKALTTYRNALEEIY